MRIRKICGPRFQRSLSWWRTCAIWLLALPTLSLAVHAQDVSVKASLKFPSQHPYLLVTPVDPEHPLSEKDVRLLVE